ncbi:calcium/proton exchanger [Gigaspora margarita]|uniref:Calcium/proton exchanger n=1 Tax=Gigaspora margarita TaxID=4874 RepID=A0A8H4ABE8_GIGMA|nr:calcium/proton exchanger [Gigaspora margarita]
MPIKDIESQLFKNKHLNKVFSLFKSIGNGKFWIGFLLEIVLVIVIFVINIFWENHWFNLVITSFNLLLFAYVMNKCVEGIADRSNNFLTGLINNMGGNIAELFAVIIFMKSDQALLAGFTIIGSSISTVMIVPALAAIISIFRNANDTNEENLENEDDKNAKKRLIELIILILLFAITCAGFYFVGEIFSDSLQKTPLSERLAFVGIFFTPAMLDVPEHLNTISLFVKNTDLAMITSFGSSCQILGFVYPVGTLISVGLGANPNIPFPPDFVGIYFLVLILAYNIINDGKFTLHEGLALFTTTAMVGVYSFFRVV